MSQELITTIDAAWEDRANVSLTTQGPVRQAGWDSTRHKAMTTGCGRGPWLVDMSRGPQGPWQVATARGHGWPGATARCHGPWPCHIITHPGSTMPSAP